MIFIMITYLLLLPSSVSVCPAANNPPLPYVQPDTTISVTVDTLLRAVVYKIAVRECWISFTLYDNSSINSGGVGHHYACGTPFSEQVILHKILLETMFNDSIHHELLDSVRWISWGRLGDGETELSQRLAVAAKYSALWNVKKGKPAAGGVNNMIRNLMNDGSVCDDLKKLFLVWGWKIKVASVEKVLIMEARKLPSFQSLKTRGIMPGDKVPFDCQVWFDVKRERKE